MISHSDQHSHSLLRKLASLLWKHSELRVLNAILALFLDTKLKTTLQNIRTISASTASRFFSHGYLDGKVCWQELNHWQFERLYQSRLGRKGSRPEVVLKLDLTCIEKTGKRIPFARVFNARYGIQLLTLHACFGPLSFPIATRIYEGKGKDSVVDLALALLDAFPAQRWPSRTVLLADAGFASREFLQGCRDMGFKRVIMGVRHNRILKGGHKLNELQERGGEVRLHDLPDMPLYASWCDVKREEGRKRFYIVSTFKASGQWLARRYRKRWLIESFFQRVKHDFGLKEARLRTQDGIRLWVFFSFLAYSFASFQRFSTAPCGQKQVTLAEAARQACQQLLPDYLLHALMAECEQLSSALPRYQLRLERL